MLKTFFSRVVVRVGAVVKVVEEEWKKFFSKIPRVRSSMKHFAKERPVRSYSKTTTKKGKSKGNLQRKAKKNHQLPSLAHSKVYLSSGCPCHQREENLKLPRNMQREIHHRTFQLNSILQVDRHWESI